jgi:glyoxylase-like metal-dependent hydrolase (beta-lactamase superfamily II)
VPRHAQATSNSAQVASGIWSISLPTPWPVGPVNVYLIDDDPLTLIDTGPQWSTSLAALEDGLRTLGRGIEDIGRVIITHHHLDHGGQAQLVVDRSGAELCALDGLVDWFATYPASAEAEDQLADRVLRRHGTSDEALAAVWAINVEVRRFGAPASVTNPLSDGDVVEFANRRLRVLHRPGHSPSDTIFHDEQRGVLLAGDVLLPHVRSSALISPPLDGSEVHVRPRAFMQYLQSLKSTAAMDLDVVLPGHGEPIRNHRPLIAERLDSYDRNTEKVGALLTTEPRTASELALALRGKVPDPVSFFALCDVLGHLDRLLDAGRIVEIDNSDHSLKRFALA